MSKFIGLLGQGAGALIGNAVGGNSQRNDMNHIKELDQFRAMLERRQAGFYHNLDMGKWHKTNYEAQVSHMKNAGLNVGLMYGMGGGQGASANSTTPNSSNSGNPNQPHMMGIGMQSAVQGLTAQANIELMKSQAKKNNAEANKIEGVDTEQAKAQTLNTKVQTELSNLYLEIGKATKDDQIDEVFHRVEGLIKNNNLTDEQINLAKQQGLESISRTALNYANKNVSEQQIKNMQAEIEQGWERINVMYEDLLIKNQGNKIQLMRDKQNLQKMQQDWLIAVMKNKVDWEHITIEQQKVLLRAGENLTNMFGTSRESYTKTTGSGGTKETWTTKY